MYSKLASWKSGKKYLLYKTDSNCKNKSATNCTSNEKCNIYRSETRRTTMCVNKNSIKTFEKGSVIKNKLYDLPYRLINHSEDKAFEQYLILEDENNCFILFNYGEVLYENILYGEELKKNISIIAQKIIRELSGKYENLVLCGHSIGCVFASMIGMQIFKENPEFRDKLYVIGSAPFKWLRPIDADLYNQYKSNFIIFGGEFLAWSRVPIIDPWLSRGTEDLLQTTVALISGNTRRPPGGQINSIIKLSEYEPPKEEINLDPGLAPVYHMWGTYFILLKLLTS